jgi:Tol biopolymer transport system component
MAPPGSRCANWPGASSLADLQSHSLEVIDKASDGSCGASNAGASNVSADGRYVAFGSTDSKLASRDPEPGPGGSIRDRARGLTNRVTQAGDGGNPNNGTGAAGVSPDGRLLIFSSRSTNIVSSDTNGSALDVFYTQIRCSPNSASEGLTPNGPRG